MFLMRSAVRAARAAWPLACGKWLAKGRIFATLA
jgi:hypothetical protein